MNIYKTFSSYLLIMFLTAGKLNMYLNKRKNAARPVVSLRTPLYLLLISKNNYFQLV